MKSREDGRVCGKDEKSTGGSKGSIKEGTRRNEVTGR